jgi:hypothetical protein
MLVSFYVSKLSADFRVKFLVTPGEGGPGGLGIEGQKGGPGGIGGIMPCSPDSRAAQGPPGLDAPKGEDGSRGVISQCHGMTIGSNLVGRADLSASPQCPNPVQLEHQTVHVPNWNDLLIQSINYTQIIKENHDDAYPENDFQKSVVY